MPSVAPNLELVERVGTPARGADPIEAYLESGRRICDAIVELLPAGWDWTGTKVLDFGCGAGRVLRHFVDIADGAELHGCDIHKPSIAWLRAHMSPPVHPVRNDERPPL